MTINELILSVQKLCKVVLLSYKDVRSARTNHGRHELLIRTIYVPGPLFRIIFKASPFMKENNVFQS
jgi:hypothetical protein